MPLSSQRRTQLDGIVQQLASHNAPKDAVQSIVKDFLGKYQNEPSIPTDALSKAANPFNPGNIQAGNQTTPNQSMGSGLDVAKGIAKGVGSTVFDIGSLGNKVLGGAYNATIGKMTGKPVQTNIPKPSQLTPQGTAQNIGFVAEQMGEMLIPVGGEETAAKLGTKLESGVKDIPMIGKAVGAVAKILPETKWCESCSI